MKIILDNGKTADRPLIRSNSFKKATIILIIGLLLSKVTGQAREVLYGVVLQKPYLTDAYVQGFLIPDFIYELLIGGSIQAALIPTLAQALGTEQEKKAWYDVSTFISFFSILMFICLLLLEIFTQPILSLISKSENLTLTVQVARRLFPQTFFMMGAGLTIGILNAHKLFTKTALGPGLYNIFVCLSLILLGAASEKALLQVAWGISGSAAVYFIWQLFLARRVITPLRLNLHFSRPGFWRLLLLALPTLFSASIAQLGNIILQAYTKTMPAGSATALRYASTVWMLPYGIFTVAIGQVMLPTLSTCIGHNDPIKAGRMLNKALRLVLLFALPSALIFYAYRTEIMVGIFWWKNYLPASAAANREYYDILVNAGRILQFYCPAIIFQSVIYIYNFAFYAHSITVIPLVNAAVSLLLTLGLGYIAEQRQEISGLSLAFAVSTLFIALLLQALYHHRFKPEKLRNFAYFIWQNWVALTILALYLLVEVHVSARIPYVNKLFSLAVIGARALVAYAVYLAAAYLVGIKEIKEIRRLWH